MKRESSGLYLIQTFLWQNVKLDQVDEAIDTLSLANLTLSCLENACMLL